MPSQVVALLLAFVMLWSGLGTIEVAGAPASPLEELTSTLVDAPAPVPASGHEGSVEQHHLDDLPMQVQSDPGTGALGRLPSILMTRAASALLLPSPALAAADTRPPFLAGPLRPPCSAALAG
jgi:hypothetical protein